MNRLMNRHRLRSLPGGFSMIEAVVAAGILLVTMRVSLQMIHRVDGVWTDAAQHRVAAQELSNHLDRLTRLSSDDVRKQLDALSPSRTVSETLVDARLSGVLQRDEWGERLVLELNWERRHPGPAVRLSGWLRPANDSNQESQP